MSSALQWLSSHFNDYVRGSRHIFLAKVKFLYIHYSVIEKIYNWDAIAVMTALLLQNKIGWVSHPSEPQKSFMAPSQSSHFPTLTSLTCRNTYAHECVSLVCENYPSMSLHSKFSWISKSFQLFFRKKQSCTMKTKVLMVNQNYEILSQNSDFSNFSRLGGNGLPQNCKPKLWNHCLHVWATRPQNDGLFIYHCHALLGF